MGYFHEELGFVPLALFLHSGPPARPIMLMISGVLGVLVPRLGFCRLVAERVARSPVACKLFLVAAPFRSGGAVWEIGLFVVVLSRKGEKEAKEAKDTPTSLDAWRLFVTILLFLGVEHLAVARIKSLKQASLCWLRCAARDSREASRLGSLDGGRNTNVRTRHLAASRV